MYKSSQISLSYLSTAFDADVEDGIWEDQLTDLLKLIF